MPFEPGNFQGQNMDTIDRHFDKIYIRNYLPDAMKQISYEKQGGAYLVKQPYVGPNMPQNSNLHFRKIVRERAKQMEKHLAIRTGGPSASSQSSTRPQTQAAFTRQT
jgi:hypothetical protein